VVGPFNRVEGDLEVSLDIADGRIAAAYVNSPLYRGFEQILHRQDAARCAGHRAAHLRHLLGGPVGGRRLALADAPDCS
jgi:hypothetical protein